MQTQLIEMSSAQFPIGIILPYAGITDIENLEKIQQAGWYLCDGSEVSRNLPLYKVVGDIYGRGDGVQTFNLPDYRGRFLRGVDNPTGICSAGRDIDAAERTESGVGGFTGDRIGSVQEDAIKKKSLHIQKQYNAEGTTGKDWSLSHGDVHTAHATHLTFGDSDETRPINISVSWIVFAGRAADNNDDGVKKRICS